MTTRRILIAIGFVTALVLAVLFTVTSVGGNVLEPIQRVLSPAAAPAPNPPSLINYQGRLTDSGTGDPVADGSYSVRFSIWDAAAAGNEQWNETQGTVTVTDGLFSVLLGSVTPITKGVFSATDRYLEIKVGADPAMTPRQRFAAVAYAFVALNANTADSAADLSCAGCVDSADIADGSVGVLDLAGDSVKSFQIVDGTVAKVDLDGNSVNSSKIADGTVAKVDLAADSVNSSKIADGTVAKADLAADSVNSSKIADFTIQSADLQGNSVNTSKIIDGQVFGVDLAADSVNSSKIADGSVAKVDLAADSVNSSKIADGSVIDADLANDYLRADAGDTYSGSALTIGPASVLDLRNANGGVRLSNNAGNGTQIIYFYDDNSPTNEFLQWNDSLDRFSFSNDLSIGDASGSDNDFLRFDQGAQSLKWDESDGRFEFSDNLFVPNNLRINSDFGNSILYFQNGLESLLWNDTDFRFELSDELVVDDDLRIGDAFATDQDFLYFDQGNEYILWNDTLNRFVVSDHLSVLDDLSIGDGSPGDADFLYFDQATENLAWDEGLDRFSFSDDLHVIGTLTATTKSAVVETSQGTRLTYVQESTENWFEDFGSARLDAGSAVVEIEPLFAETINTDIDYHVYLTPLGATSGLYVASKGADSFEVRASDGADLAFDYRIVAKRLGYEDERLEPFEGGELAEPSDSDAGLDSAAEIDAVELDTSAAADVAPEAGSPALADAAAEGAGGSLYALFIALPLAGAAIMLLAGLVGRKRLLRGRS